MGISEGMRKPTAIAKMALTAAALCGIAIFAVVLVLHFAEGERERELRLWQSRLSLVAETRAAEVNTWLADQFGELAQLSENTSLQLYMTELVQGAGRSDRVTGDLARSGYLANLLTVVAERSGFAGRMTGPDVPANVRRVGVAGIVLVGMNSRPVAASAGAPPIEGRLYEFLSNAPRGQRALLDIHRGASGSPTMGFAAPVFTVHGDGAAARQIGWVLGIKEIADGLFPRLHQPGTVWKSAEAVLVRRTGATIEYLSPMIDGGAPLSRALAADTPGLAASFAIDNIGGFARQRDYRDRDVLVTSRRLALAPWTLAYKIDREEALGASESRVSGLIIRFLLAIAVIAAAFVAVWRHGASRRAAQAAARFEELAHRHEAQGRFLRLVTDCQPSALFIVDPDNRYRFANHAAASSAGIADADMIGKTMASVLGPAAARRYEAANREVLETGRPCSEVYRGAGTGDGEERIVRAEHVPVRDAVDLASGVMVVEHDVTAAIRERERRARTLNQLVQTLLTVVDRRDPYAANHSTRVAIVARAIAEEMDADEETAETAAIAGSMMNIGKILVPTDILTRDGELGDDEIRHIRDSIQASADLLGEVEFDGPVVETLRQFQERWDGGGTPGGLAGDAILLSARIVAVANAFIAMISPRAYRAGASFDEVVERLIAESGKSYDRRVVTALVNRLDNRGARTEWRDFESAATAA